jgi:hypothetical protein
MIRCLVCLSNNWVQWNKGVPWTINNFDHILISLCTISLESLESRFWKPLSQHHFIKLFPHMLLNFGDLGLHITNHYGQLFTISMIVHMTNQSCLANNTLHMIQASCESPASCIHVTRMTPLLTPFIDIFKINTFYPKTYLRKLHS